MAGWRAKIIRRTARVRLVAGLMRLLTAIVSGGTSKLMFPVLAKI